MLNVTEDMTEKGRVVLGSQRPWKACPNLKLQNKTPPGRAGGYHDHRDSHRPTSPAAGQPRCAGRAWGHWHLVSQPGAKSQ